MVVGEGEWRPTLFLLQTMIGLGAGIGRQGPGSYSEKNIPAWYFIPLNDMGPHPTPTPKCGEEGAVWEEVLNRPRFHPPNEFRLGKSKSPYNAGCGT